jgi:hypothetical protein
MLEIRNNRVLFQYLEVCSVNYSDEHGWSITGHTKEGRTEIYETAGGVLRFTLPIPVPQFVTISILQRILEGLQGNIEGLLTAAEEDGAIFIEYHLHSTNESLDKGLLKFVEERAEINKGFQELQQEYLKIQRTMGSISQSIASSLNKSKSDPLNNNSKEGLQLNEPDLSGLWKDMESIDSKNDDSNEGDGFEDINLT